MSAPGPDWTWSPTEMLGGGEDVALLAVGVVQQGDVAAAVRVVLDRRDLGRHAVLEALEVDLAVAALGAAAAVAGGDAAVDVAAAGLAQALGQLALRARRRSAARAAGRSRSGARGWSVLFCGSASSSPYAVSAPSNSSIRSPGASWTIAFFQARVRPW